MARILSKKRTCPFSRTVGTSPSPAVPAHETVRVAAPRPVEGKPAKNYFFSATLRREEGEVVVTATA